jgi:DNA repair protein RadC
MPVKTGKKNLAGRLQYKLPRLKLCLVQDAGAQNYPRYKVNSPYDAIKFLEPLRHEPEEHFVSIHLNCRNEVIGLHEVSHGTLSASLVHPREVFKAALLANSHAILVCHNHPSGAAITPSVEDLATTSQLLEAAKIMSVVVMDHLIVSPSHPAFSLRQHHPELWT